MATSAFCAVRMMQAPPTPPQATGSDGGPQSCADPWPLQGFAMLPSATFRNELTSAKTVRLPSTPPETIRKPAAQRLHCPCSQLRCILPPGTSRAQGAASDVPSLAALTMTVHLAPLVEPWHAGVALAYFTGLHCCCALRLEHWPLLAAGTRGPPLTTGLHSGSSPRCMPRQAGRAAPPCLAHRLGTPPAPS